MHWRTSWSLVAALLAAVAVASTATAAPKAPHAAGATRIAQLELDVLSQLNSVRREHGLVALKLSRPLSTAAGAHTGQMGQTGSFKHESGDGSPFWKRVERFYPSKGSRYWAVGENLLWSSPSLDGPEALKLWMASPEHRANILTAKWREIGISAIQVAAAPGDFSGLDVTIVATEFGIRR